MYNIAVCSSSSRDICWLSSGLPGMFYANVFFGLIKHTRGPMHELLHKILLPGCPFNIVENIDLINKWIYI